MKNMRKHVAFLLSAALIMTIFAGCGQKSEGNETAATEDKETVVAEETAEEEVDLSEEYTATNTVEITVKDYGTITVELDANQAPATVENFLNLVNEGFYDGLTFHRIISGFMIQGGDPNGNGTGGSGTNIKGEFSQNGFNNEMHHYRGAISMARANDPDSASSQFFIVHQDSFFLDGGYAVFGYVTSGMEVVDAICENTTVQDKNGTVLAEDQPIIESIKEIK